MCVCVTNDQSSAKAVGTEEVLVTAVANCHPGSWLPKKTSTGPSTTKRFSVKPAAAAVGTNSLPSEK